jgi:hypothetical protein
MEEDWSSRQHYFLNLHGGILHVNPYRVQALLASPMFFAVPYCVGQGDS